MKKPTLLAASLLGLLIIGAALFASRGIPSFPPSVDTNASSSSLGVDPTLPVLDGQLPEFTGISKWWNTVDNQPLTPEGLRGKVVLVDFWTYSCINCIRTYPFLKAMHERYADKGLVIVAVHTPEFAFEAEADNVEREIKKNGLLYPVALDPTYATWNAYHNRYWPAEYLFDHQGRLRRTHFGEGGYEESEQAIRSLLEESRVALQPMEHAVPTPDLSNIETPETYFGLRRGEAFTGTVGQEGIDTTYGPAKQAIAPNAWGIEGTWKFEPEYVQADSPNALFQFNVHANTLHIVMESSDGKDKKIEITIDGQVTKTMMINASTLYTIATLPHDGRHVVRIRIVDPGVRFYAATFS